MWVGRNYRHLRRHRPTQVYHARVCNYPSDEDRCSWRVSFRRSAFSSKCEYSTWGIHMDSQLTQRSTHGGSRSFYFWGHLDPLVWSWYYLNGKSLGTWWHSLRHSAQCQGRHWSPHPTFWKVRRTETTPHTHTRCSTWSWPNHTDLPHHYCQLHLSPPLQVSY